jgi:hypothetical protein
MATKRPMDCAATQEADALQRDADSLQRDADSRQRDTLIRNI